MNFKLLCQLAAMTLMLFFTINVQSQDCEDTRIPSVGGTHYQNALQIPEIQMLQTAAYNVFRINPNLIKANKDLNGETIDLDGGYFQYNWFFASAARPNSWMPVGSSCRPSMPMNNLLEGTMELQVWYINHDRRISADEYKRPQKKFKKVRRLRYQVGVLSLD